MHSTRSVILFVLILTTFVALVLSSMFTALKPIHEMNEAVYNKKAILSAVQAKLEQPISALNDEQIAEIFTAQIKQTVIDMSGATVEEAQIKSIGYQGGRAEDVRLAKESKKAESDMILPVFEFTAADKKKYYIISVRGKGLWDAIWGNIALESDLNTIAGVAFDHQGETPGLGAEIKDSKAFQDQFIGKKLYGEGGAFKSIYVRKGGAKDPVHEVDGLSGATITADGVTEMMKRGIQYYEPYFETIKS